MSIEWAGFIFFGIRYSVIIIVTKVIESLTTCIMAPVTFGVGRL